jgi:hypothetical protein
MVVSFIDKEKERQKPVKEHRKLNMNPIKNRLNSVSSRRVSSSCCKCGTLLLMVMVGQIKRD